MEFTHSDGCYKQPLPAGKTGDVDADGNVVDERPDMATWLTARLRFWIVCSWLPDDGEAGTPAVTS